MTKSEKVQELILRCVNRYPGITDRMLCWKFHSNKKLLGYVINFLPYLRESLLRTERNDVDELDGVLWSCLDQLENENLIGTIGVRGISTASGLMEITTVLFPVNYSVIDIDNLHVTRNK